MKKYRGGQFVTSGFYWNRASWRLEMIEGPGGTLPGGAETRYAVVPVVAMLLMAPILGALFVVVLPFVGLPQLTEASYIRSRAALRRRAPEEGIAGDGQ